MWKLAWGKRTILPWIISRRWYFADCLSDNESKSRGSRGIYFVRSTLIVRIFWTCLTGPFSVRQSSRRVPLNARTNIESSCLDIWFSISKSTFCQIIYYLSVQRGRPLSWNDLYDELVHGSEKLGPWTMRLARLARLPPRFSASLAFFRAIDTTVAGDLSKASFCHKRNSFYPNEYTECSRALVFHPSLLFANCSKSVVSILNTFPINP